jgi:hypothetical protein
VAHLLAVGIRVGDDDDDDDDDDECLQLRARASPAMFIGSASVCATLRIANSSVTTYIILSTHTFARSLSIISSHIARATEVATS